MKTVRELLGLAVGLSACSAATLPFKPETPSPGSAISADYIILADGTSPTSWEYNGVPVGRNRWPTVQEDTHP